jgi:hypothetical protein
MLVLGALAAAGACCSIGAADSGSPRDAAAIRTDAKILLAHRARLHGADPREAVVTDLTVAGEKADLSWTIGSMNGRMTLRRRGGRWWDVTPSMRANAAPPGCSVCGDAVRTQGGALQPPRGETAGYAFSVTYAKNDASPGTIFSQFYARSPSPAEFLPYPTPGSFTSNAVLYFDVSVTGPRPVTFDAGSSIDVWFPFVLDDRLRYDLTIGFANAPIGPVDAIPYDNTLHFVLPGFTVAPHTTLMAEVDGDLP